MSKERPPTAQIGKKAILHVCNVFNDMNWETNEAHPDTGVDLHVKVFNTPPLPPKSLSLGLNVQVKGTRQHRIRKDGYLDFKLETKHIFDWIKSNIPLLFIVCCMNDLNVEAAYYLWIDEYVYSVLKWPIGMESPVKSKSITVKIPTKNVFDKNCNEVLKNYVSQWGPMTRTVKNLNSYLCKGSKEIKNEHSKRSKYFRWDLFALPIRYKRSQTGSKANIVDGENNLIKNGGQRICLLGKPATGKTITIDRIIANHPFGLIPISVRDFLPATKQIKQILFEKISRLLNTSSLRHVEYIYEQERFLFFVDGLNERTKFKELSKSIIDLSKKLPKARLIVTCRTDDYNLIGNPLKKFATWEIIGLTNKAQDAFIKKQEEDVQKLVKDKFREQPKLREFCRNQFLFLIALVLIIKKEAKGQSFLKSELYERYLNSYLEWMKLDEFARKDIIQNLSKVAFEMRKGKIDRTTISFKRLTDILLSELEDDLVEPLKKKLFESGLIEKIGAVCKFYQETLQEYLCARYLIRKGKFPNEFDKYPLSFDGVELNDMIRSFYIESGRFEILIKDEYRDKNIWL